MILISHRGNIGGPNKKFENEPEYILLAIKNGFHVEIDVWLLESNGFYLGHDYPKIPININFLKNEKLWCHAKNLEALTLMLNNNIRCFWHENDRYTITSNGYIWAYPDKKVNSKSIAVCKNKQQTKKNYKLDIYGICSDYVGIL